MIAQKWKLRGILTVLALTFFLGERQIEPLGDRYQYALPLLALGCSISNGQALDYMARYLVQLAIVHGSKRAWGDTSLNQRPRGGLQGMPSGHTATAVFGASNLVHECIEKNIAVKAAVIVTALFVGGSRVQSKAHDIWQVLVGALVGWGCDRGFRRVLGRRNR
jgi:membrane-associated phospholipid phosphatase